MRLLEIERAVRICAKCHYCHSSSVELCPMALEFDQKPFAPPGIFNLAEGLVDGVLKMGPELSVIPFACTTCGACAKRCPSLDLHKAYPYPTELIEGVRGMFVEEGAIPAKITEVLSSFETMKNAWRLPAKARLDWENGLTTPVPDFRKARNEYLLFVGDASLVTDTKHVPKAVAALLQKGGIDFGTLKEQEVDSGNDVRAMGERGLFEELARQNIDTFKRYGVKKVITISPHDYQALAHDYPKLGMQFDGVYHYTEVVAELLREGKLRLGKKFEKTVTFQDPCHLGRYRGVYEAPREVIQSVPGMKLVEMQLNREFAFCCGAGGGRMWHEPAGRKARIADARLDHARDAGAEVVVTACPYCLSNLKGADLGTIEIKDIAELVLEAMSD
jgi:Fe-S oxidoreductase